MKSLKGYEHENWIKNILNRILLGRDINQEGVKKNIQRAIFKEQRKKWSTKAEHHSKPDTRTRQRLFRKASYTVMSLKDNNLLYFLHVWAMGKGG